MPRNRMTHFIVAGLLLTIAIVALAPISLFAQTTTVLHYAVMAGEVKGGEVHYHLTQQENIVTLRSFLVDNNGAVWEDAEVIMDSETLLPLSSWKTIPYPAGSIEMNTLYSKEKATIELNAPAGRKKAVVPLPHPAYDLEQVPFIFSFLNPSTLDSFEVWIVVPISGMTWKGRLRLISDQSGLNRFRFALAGEVLFFRFSPEYPYYPEEIEAPHRGYTLQKISSSAPDKELN